MKHAVENNSLADIFNAQTMLLMQIEDATMDAEIAKHWHGGAPLFAQQVGKRLHCDPAHKMVFDFVLDTVRMKYREALVAMQPKAPTLLIPLAHVFTPEQLQEASREALDRWVLDLSDHPRIGDAPAEPEEIEPTRLEAIVDGEDAALSD